MKIYLTIFAVLSLYFVVWGFQNGARNPLFGPVVAALLVGALALLVTVIKALLKRN